VENNPNTPAIEMARKFNLPPSSLSCIMKKKQSIVDEEVQCGGEANTGKCLFNIKYICDYEKASLSLDWCRNSLF
jgi:hypothetical protein